MSDGERGRRIPAGLFVGTHLARYFPFDLESPRRGPREALRRARSRRGFRWEQGDLDGDVSGGSKRFLPEGAAGWRDKGLKRVGRLGKSERSF